MARFLHTADWQLGSKLRYVRGDRGAKVRNERFEAVRRLAELARKHEVDAVVVAGDVFDDNAVGPHTLQAARDALALFAPIPVLLLPGNHDAGTPDCALSRLDAARHVRVLLDHTPVEIGGIAFHPCPLLRRHQRDDPTAHLPDRGASTAIRVAIAHGGVLDFSESVAAPNRIDAPSVLARGFDYLALGDWHGTWNMGPRVWYPGTPEPTRFTETRPGNALLVDIAAAGAEPEVTVVPVARTRWHQRTVTFEEPGDLDALVAWFDGLDERAMTLVELTLQGALSLTDRARLDAVLQEQADALLFLRFDDDALQDAPTPGDLAALSADGFVGAAADALRADERPESRDALRLLFRTLREVPA